MFRPLQSTSEPATVPWVALAPLVYVLSVGPVGWVIDCLVADLGTFVTIMVVLSFPLVWLAEHVSPIEDVLRWYLDLWF